MYFLGTLSKLKVTASLTQSVILSWGDTGSANTILAAVQRTISAYAANKAIT